MNLDFIYSCLLTGSEILLIGWTGVLVAASIVTFRESPVLARSGHARKQT